MNIDEILKPYYKQNKGGLDEWIDYYDAKEAIKEIVTKALDMAAENAETKPMYSGHDSYNVVDKYSITQTINQIKF